MRWLIIVCLLACNANGNGLHDVKNGGDADHDIDVNTVQPGVFYCAAMSSAKWSVYPCWETSAGCESNRAAALSNGYDAGDCEKFPFAICFHAQRSKDDYGWDCRRTQILCEEAREREMARGYEVSDCKRVPPEGWQKSSHRRRWLQHWRTAQRGSANSTTTQLPS